MIPELQSERVLASEFVDGLIRLDNAEGLRRAGLSSTTLGKTVAEAFAELTLVHGVVHGDPHAGNVYARRGPDGEQLVILDHGLHHKLVDADRVAMCRLICACALGSRSEVRVQSEHFAGALWKLFPLVLNPAFAVAVPLTLKAIKAAHESRLPDDISLHDVWKTLLAMHDSDSDILGALHSMGYVRGLLNHLQYPEKMRVLALVQAAAAGVAIAEGRPRCASSCCFSS